jgi:hypothetical protein
MKFEKLLFKAKEKDEDAVMKIVEMYKPLLVKNSIVDGCFDEDLYQELTKELLIRIQTYKVLK